jgi:hypothetical protein
MNKRAWLVATYDEDHLTDEDKRKELLLACENGDWERVRHWLRQGVVVTKKMAEVTGKVVLMFDEQFVSPSLEEQCQFKD